MTVPNIPGTTGAIAGDGSNNVWPFSFSVAGADQIDVIRTSAAGGSEVIDASLYSVALTNGGANGGQVTYPLTSARVTATDTITVQLVPDFNQPTRLEDQGDYNPRTVERAIDHAVRLAISLKSEVARSLLVPRGFTADIGTPRNGSPVFWDQLIDGSYRLTSGIGSAAVADTSQLRVLYADDLGLKGDGTDETAAINAKILELSEAGKPTIIYLRAAAGYWPLSAQLKIRSGISLSMGSPFRATKNGQVGFVGNYSRESAGATVTSTTASGSTTIPVTPVSGSVSSSFAVNDQVELGNGQRTRITGIDDTLLTIAVADATTSSQSAGSTIRRLVFSYCTSDWTRYDRPNEISVADNSKFATGDLVLVTDDELTVNFDTGGTFPINREIAKVIGLGSGTVKLDRSIKHWMTTANYARVVKLNPCQYASLSGATIEFTEAPSATRVDTFSSSIAYKCQILNCSVPNEDSYGTRGRSFSLDLCYQCDVIECSSGPAKYKSAGEGYGIAFSHSTDCSATGFRALGPRHVVSFLAATDCVARQVSASDWELNLIDWHGLREIGCWAYEVNGVGSGRSSQSGIVLGNPSWRGGSYECGAEGGEITDLIGTSSRGIRCWGPAGDCDVRSIVFRNLYTGVHGIDQVGDGAIEAGEVRISCDFHRCFQPVNVDMNVNGSTNKPFNRLDLTGSRFFNCEGGIVVDSLDDFVMRDVVYRTNRATASGYALEIYRTTLARVSRFVLDGAQKHIKLVDTPASIEDSIVVNPVTTAWIDELSGSAVSGGVRDIGLIHPSGWTPVRVSAATTLTVYSRPGML